MSWAKRSSSGQRSTVRRRKTVRSYAGLTISAAGNTIGPLTEKAYEYALEFLDKRVTDRTGNLRAGMSYDVKGHTGAVKNDAPHAFIVEYGTEERATKTGENRGRMKPHSFMRAGKNKALREIRKIWKEGLRKALDEQSTGS
ncbi:hypothetical protein [Sediminispirochaeta smaragdinae]|uniref:Phage protein, HK97 gp10 family n=1 Tax=Sediminispirochaeta smaragdinae (strain DSM 11293 / JCM 15392 / SEBR 4228) TaxID=573413 RepID=E1R1H3_SEDSS|nr:hypothetical protein [Sediminispirochaeta smaragdinae]ADK81114.1 hypothetical protein Spirs_1992 [Sediminispirochaeta smaragdinae DSM 11293]